MTVTWIAAVLALALSHAAAPLKPRAHSENAIRSEVTAIVDLFYGIRAIPSVRS